MQLVEPAMRLAAVRMLKAAENDFGVRVLHASIAPASGDPRENRGEQFQLRVSFVRPPAAYFGIDGATNISAGTMMAPNAPIRLVAMDARDAFASVRQSTSSMALAVLSPYMDAITAEPLARNRWIESLAPQLAALGPTLREGMKQILDMRLDVARRYLRGELGRPDQGPPVGGGFGVPVAFGGQEVARARYVVGSAYAALAAATALAHGQLPPADELDFPEQLRQRGIPSLRQLMAQPAHTELMLDQIQREVTAYVVQVGPALNAGRNPFGGPVNAPDESPEAIARIINRGLPEQIQNALANFAPRNEQDLVARVLVDGQEQELEQQAAPAAIAVVAAPAPPPAMAM